MDLEVHGHRGIITSDLQLTCDCGWQATGYFPSSEAAAEHFMRDHALAELESRPPDWLMTRSDVLREQIEEMITSRPVVALQLLAEIERWHRPLTDRAVAAARTSGSTWAEIGDTLGVSRQAAHERFSAVADR
ncbi:hypothetical protein EV193_106134 [Herbihabitans rhizosphaerae]|uniref:Sigma-70-like protein n=1 Tax=Herbihabitans rhizosphaerae TaxID=1872711 RepID=A0A4Q7KLZ6_9PSEU|nr:hypothetical protein [Herbihabitans rhizosphaerae]RZS36900.1 hypothetical protein EV193_106134 [Herbihabitans rhizosphaerae]